MRRPQRILGIWARLTLLGVAVTVLVMAAMGLVARAIRPYREVSAQTRQLAQAKQRVAALDTQNEELRRRIALLNTPSGIVTEARKMGYLKPGEIPFIVETPASQDAPVSDPQIRRPVPTSPKPHSR